MKKPINCKTPKTDKDFYNLTATDLNTMIKRAQAIWDMLSYYSNMPENKTGVICISNPHNEEKLDKLCELVEDIQQGLVGITYNY